MAKQPLVLSVIIESWGGTHPGAWRHPDAPDDPTMDFERVKQMVQTAERGKVHMFFLADELGHMLERDPAMLSLTSNAVKYEPFTLCSALSMVTSRIGLALTASTTYSEPFNVARMFASLDRLSAGRACWNVVSSTGEAAQNFNNIAVEHSTRYKRASEFFDVVTELWDSWEDDTFIRDKASGVYFAPDKLHVPDHVGEYFQVKGPLNVDRPVQGYPVIAQAGASPAGQAFAARIADVLFTLDLPIDQATELYASFKERVAENGRDPQNVKVLPAIQPVLGRTQAEAEERLAMLDELADPRIGIERLKGFIDFDLTGYPLDAPVPEVPETEHWSKSTQTYFLDRARKENLTIGQLAQVALQFFTAPMSTDAFVDFIVERRDKEAADGFNVCFPDANGSLELFVDDVIPKLQRRGLFHEDYAGRTLRENLGIPRPQNQFAAMPSIANQE